MCTRGRLAAWTGPWLVHPRTPSRPSVVLARTLLIFDIAEGISMVVEGIP